MLILPLCGKTLLKDLLCYHHCSPVWCLSKEHFSLHSSCFHGLTYLIDHVHHLINLGKRIGMRVKREVIIFSDTMFVYLCSLLPMTFILMSLRGDYWDNFIILFIYFLLLLFLEQQLAAFFHLIFLCLRTVYITVKTKKKVKYYINTCNLYIRKNNLYVCFYTHA